MNVDIYLREKNGKREIRFPILPEEIRAQMGETSFVSYEIMRKGEYSVPTGVGLATYSWESEFPGSLRKNDALIRGTWKDPKTYHNILEDWKANGTALTLLVTGYPINSDVYIRRYEPTATGAYGDLNYEIELLQKRDIVIQKTVVEKAKATTTTTKRTTESSKTYTIKKGDSLWWISYWHYGTGTRYQEIYEANKEVLDAEAKKYGHASCNAYWIYPGVTIKIPK